MNTDGAICRTVPKELEPQAVESLKTSLGPEFHRVSVQADPDDPARSRICLKTEGLGSSLLEKIISAFSR